MGGGGGGTQTTTQNPNPALQPLMWQTGGIVGGLQPTIASQFGDFFSPQPQQIPGLTQGQQDIAALQQQRAFGQPLTSWEQAAGGVVGGLGTQNQQEQLALQNAQGQLGYNVGETNALNVLNRPEVGGYGSTELGAISRLYGGDILGGAFNPAEQAALGQINQFTGGAIGQSPATQAAMAAARTPVLNELAQAGLGNSDAIASSLGGAYAPILAQELATRAQVIPQLANLGQQQRAGTLQATGQLANLGQAMRSGLISEAQAQAAIGGQMGSRGLQAANLQAQLGQQLRGGQTTQAQLLQQLGATEAGRQSTLLGEYGQSEEAARQIAQQQGQAQLNDLLRRQQLGTQFTTGILGGFPAISGQTVKSTGGK